MEEWKTKDSGEMQKFKSGAQRDAQKGKGRFDLISPFAEDRLAGVYQRGAEKYGDRNYEKGMPLSRYLDSAKRHINKVMKGMKDEDHLAQALWNISSAIHTQEMIDRGLLPAELNDLPDYTPKNKEESK